MPMMALMIPPMYMTFVIVIVIVIVTSIDLQLCTIIATVIGLHLHRHMIDIEALVQHVRQLPTQGIR